ncbi:MAG: hypothetical protein JHC78_05350 [Ilumatobacteraceae bacterium]|nr:hypothetical protein [Ilumatobacteraceae bacterium]
MNVSFSSEMSNSVGRITLIVSHARDAQADEARKYLGKLAELGLTRVVYWLCIDPPITSIVGDFEVDELGPSGTNKVKLFGVLSAIGGVTAVDVVALSVGVTEDTAIESLITTVPVICKAFERWIRNAPISDVRISARGYGVDLPDKGFFAAAAKNRVVVMPLDPSHDFTVYRPLSGPNPESMSGHVAVEIASLLGCWSVQKEVPLDLLNGAGQSDGSGIHFVMSSVRALAVPAPPISEALGNSTQLPTPTGFTAVPRPERLAVGLADEIYPADLVFKSTEQPEGPTEFMRIDRFIQRFLRQFINAVVSLPRVVRQGIQHEMDDLAITAMQDSIGGAASSLGLTSSRLKRNAQDGLDFEQLIEQMIAKTATDLDQNYRFGIPAQDWQLMAHKVFSLADGDGEPTTRLLTDDAVISSIDVLVPACGPTTSREDVIRELLEPVEDSANSSVIENISRKFLGEISRATSSVATALQQMRELPNIIRMRPEIKGDDVIRVAAVLGAALIVISLGAFSPLRPVFAFEWLPSSVRDAAWAFPATLGGLLSVWILIHLVMKTERARRVVDVVSSLVIPIVLLTLLVRFGETRRWAMDNGGSSNYRYPVVLFVSFLVLAVFAIRQLLKSPNPKHKAFGRLGIGVGSSYLLIAAVIGLAQNEPPLIDGIPEVRGAIFIVLFPSALISFGISVSRIAIARVREIYKALLVSRLIEWGVGELRAGRDAEIRLEVLRVQWAALGAVLTRMIRYPLGCDLVSALEHDAVVTGESDPLKLDFARLNLTNRGRGGLEARLRRSVVRQGWLNQQMASVLGSFSKSAGFDRGLIDSEMTKINPLACNSTPTAQEASSGEAQGDRWTLVGDLYSGAFEEVLRLPADQIRFDALYESVLADPRSIEVVGAERETGGVLEYLNQSVSNNRLTVPVGFLNILVTGGDSRLEMDRLVWWPVSLVEPLSEVRPTDVELRESELIKPWPEFGTRFALSMQVSWSKPFLYEDFIASRKKLPEAVVVAPEKSRV